MNIPYDPDFDVAPDNPRPHTSFFEKCSPRLALLLGLGLAIGGLGTIGFLLLVFGFFF